MVKSARAVGPNDTSGFDGSDAPGLLVAIAATIVAFDRIDRRAALLMFPALAWVAFATSLDAGFWSLN